MADELTDKPGVGVETLKQPPFFSFVIGEQPGQYELSTNVGEAWKWHVLKLASQIRKELESG